MKASCVRLGAAGVLVVVASCGGGPSSLPAPTSAASACSNAGPTPRIVGIPQAAMSMFSAHADGDVVIVRYDGCRLEVLDTCRDESIRGRFGSYKMPTNVRGDERFTIRDPRELAARLPLASPEIADEVRSGKSLEIVVLTRGVKESTCERVSRADLAALPGCSGATHFVASYDVGAFRIQGATSASSMSGGSVASCDAAQSTELSACRVPLNVRLRPLAP